MNNQIVCQMFDHLIISFGNAVMKNGKVTPIYFNMRILPSYPELLTAVAKELLSKIHTEQFLGRRLAGLPMSGVPIAVAMGVIGNVPVLYPRGQERMGVMTVEGRYDPGETVIGIDDVLTDGVIKQHQIRMIRKTGLEVRDLIVVIDRNEGGRELLEADGIRVHSLFGLRQIVDILRSESNLGDYEYNRTLRFLGGEL